MQDLEEQYGFKLLKAVFVAIACFYCTTIQAQILVVDATNRPIMPKEYVNLKGSPYLYDDWVKGSVRLANGVEYKDIFLIYDQVKDNIMFTYEDGKMQEFVDPVAGFKLGNREFRRDLKASGNKELLSEFFEVLVDGGDTKLLKRTSKKVLDEPNIAVATKHKNIHTTTSYFLTINDEITRVKNSKSVVKALNKHKEATSDYIKKNNLNMKNEQDLIKLVSYFNSL